MELQRVLHMIGGTGETSYANNSKLQEKVIAKARNIVEASVAKLCCSTFPKRLSIADLGCSSGPNTLLAISGIIDAIGQKRRRLGCPWPELQIFLNDLPGNDFNTLFDSLPNFYETLKKEKGPDFGPCFIMGLPGSFYGRLFPTSTVDFIHSSYSLHWLSQVPPGLQDNNGVPLNRGNICIGETCPPAVFKAYLAQFVRDFSLFLRSRSEEMKSGGRLVITFLGRTSPDPSSGECCHLFGLLAKSLVDMVSEGIIEEEKVDSFNLPYYAPSIEEVKTLIDNEGSFVVELIEVTEINWDPYDNNDGEGFPFDSHASGWNHAKIIRAANESMLASHFGKGIIDDLFERYAEHSAEHLSKEKTKHVTLIISMTKKGGV